MMNSSNPLPHIEDVLPHRGNMLLIDRLIAFNNESTVAEYVPRCNAWYADVEGNMPAWIGIELMAQTIAAHVGSLKRLEGKPQKNGVLVGTRRYTSKKPSFTSEVPMRIRVTMTYQDPSGLAAYDCAITCDDAILAEATLKVFEPDNFQTFLQESFT